MCNKVITDHMTKMSVKRRDTHTSGTGRHAHEDVMTTVTRQRRRSFRNSARVCECVSAHVCVHTLSAHSLPGIISAEIWMSVNSRVLSFTFRFSLCLESRNSNSNSL